MPARSSDGSPGMAPGGSPLPEEVNGFLLKVLAADGASVRRFHLGPGEHVVGSLAEAAVRIEEAGDLPPPCPDRRARRTAAR